MIYYGTVLTFLLSALLIIYQGNVRLISEQKVSNLSFFAILFTTGLDGGLLLLPLVDFANYTNSEMHPDYGFTNVLAIEFGFWGCLSWLCYFVSTCYFAIYEPKLKVFQITWVKWLNALLIMLTCAFSAWLLLSYLDFFLPQSTVNYVKESIVVLVIFFAVISSAKILYIKWLSLFSLAVFGLLIIWVGLESQLTATKIFEHGVLLSDYFAHVNKFIFPLDAYHKFYMFWWLAWSIIIGQFTAQFVNGFRVYQLLLAILILPSVPIALWFIVLFDAFSLGIELSSYLKVTIAFIGALFVINSMDSMIKLYSVELGYIPDKLDHKCYLAIQFGLLTLITIMYDIQMLNIEIVGSIILLLWTLSLCYWLKAKRKAVMP